MVLNRRALLGLAGLSLLPLSPSAHTVGGTGGLALQAGDVVFRLGADEFVTRMIALHSPLPAAQRRWTHAGIVAAALSNGSALIAHAMPRAGVILDTLEAFSAANVSRGFGALRPPASVRAERIGSAASSWLGFAFDDGLRMSDADTIYCTELLWLALEKAGARQHWTMTRVPFFSEEVLHPDSAWHDLLGSGWTVLQG